MVEDKDKSKAQLLEELFLLQRQLSDLEKVKKPAPPKTSPPNTPKRKSTVEAVSIGEEKFFKAFMRVSTPMAITTVREGRYIDVNEAFSKIMALTREELIGNTSTGVGYITREQRALVLNELTEKGFVENLELEVTVKGGEKRHGLFNITKIELAEEEYMLTVVTDITGRVQAEKALRESEVRYRLLVDNAEFPVVVTSLVTGKGLFANERASRFFGVPAHEVSKEHAADFWAQREDRERFVNDLLENGRLSNYECQLKNRSGEVRRVRISANIIDYAGERAAFIVYNDITDRKKAEETQLRLVTAIEQCAEGIFLANTHWIIQYANPAFERMIGCDKGEIAGWHARLLKSGKHDAAFYRDIRETLARGEVWSGRAVNKRKDGTFVDVEATVSPVRDPSGRIIHYVCIHRDITQETKLEHQLRQAQKLDAIGTLAGGIAHDFNNLLMGIQGYASLMLLDLDKDHPYYEKLKAIESQVRSGAYLTRQLLGFARGGRYEVKPTDLNELIGRTAFMFGRTKKEIRVHEKYMDSLWTVEVDPGQIEQVLLNIFVNAWQAMPAGGDLYLQTENVLLDDAYVRPHEIQAGPYVKVSVTDTGFGMDEKTLQRIFDPFFTTKEMGRGVGLGLPSAYGIIKSHGGIINAYSEKGHGTTFNIYLPASDREVVRESQLSLDLQSGHETILVVDDEQVVTEVTRGMLVELGYQVLIAQDGQEALETYRANRGRIDLVILDMIMPGMGGGDVFNRMKAINPDIKVILCSGYSLNGQAKDIMARGVKTFLQKPFRIDEFSRTVREVLDGKRKEDG